MDLSQLRKGENARVLNLSQGCTLRRRLQDLGLIPGTCLRCLYIAPAGSPAVYLIRGAMVALRRCDAKNVMVEPATWD